MMSAGELFGGESARENTCLELSLGTSPDRCSNIRRHVWPSRNNKGIWMRLNVSGQGIRAAMRRNVASGRLQAVDRAYCILVLRSVLAGTMRGLCWL